MTSQIPFRKTGLTVFAIRIASIFTGMGFLIIVTRSVSPSDFGLWEFILELVAFSSVPVNMMAFWVTRRVARGQAVAKTAMVLSLLLSVIGVAAFLLSSAFLHAGIGSVLSTFIIASVMVPLSYWYIASNAIAYGYRPAATGYALIFSESCKLVAAYFLLMVYGMGITGVIVAMEIAYFVQAGTSTYLVRDIVHGRLDFSEGKRWFLDSWIPAINSLSSVVVIADTFVAPLIFSGTTVVGYYQAAFAVANLVTYSSYLSVALYPMLLGGGRGELSGTALDFTTMFGFPMAVGVVFLSRPLLFLLKPTYASGQTALSILAVSALVLALSAVMDSSLLGSEKADEAKAARHADFVRSDLLFVPVVNLLYAVGYIAVVYVILSLSVSRPIPDVVSMWATGQLAATSVMLLVKSWRARKKGVLKVPRALPVYVVGAAAVGLVAYAMSALLDYSVRSLVFAASLFGIVGVCAALYFALVYALNPGFRAMVLRYRRRRGAGGEGASGAPLSQ